MKGIGVSPGISIGRAFIIRKKSATRTGVLLESAGSVTSEIEKFDAAVLLSVEEIEAMKNHLVAEANEESLAILETQVEFLTDPELRDGVVKKIQEDLKNANDALIEVIREAVQLFMEMDDEYLRARAADIRDTGDRILKNINRSDPSTLQAYDPDTIIIAEELTPSDTLAMDVRNITGFATSVGGPTSHAAIIAKARGIPAVAGCGDDLLGIRQDDVIIIDGINGIVLVNPDAETIRGYKLKRDDFNVTVKFLKKLKDVPASTRDGKRVKLTANISSGDEMEEVFQYGGEGVGLFRTELLYMGRNSFPTEEEQVQFYKKAAMKARHHPVIVRTIDIGGDKSLPYFDLPKEQNPFLGYRAIRICLDRKDLFITQLKAILRASVSGNLKIMFPMISDLREVRSAKSILAEAKEDLKKKGIPFDENIELGIMIEIPSAALTADLLAPEIDFFSIGTNDLCQYTLAVDRMNEKIKELYDPFHPAVLRLISNVIHQAHKNNIHVGMCGEMASDPLATLLLTGMGLDEFSMSAVSIPAVKNCIIQSSLAEAREVYQKVMEMDTSEAIRMYLKGFKGGSSGN